MGCNSRSDTAALHRQMTAWLSMEVIIATRHHLDGASAVILVARLWDVSTCILVANSLARFGYIVRGGRRSRFGSGGPTESDPPEPAWGALWGGGPGAPRTGPPGGSPRAARGPAPWQFFWVFNNSPSRDRNGYDRVLLAQKKSPKSGGGLFFGPIFRSPGGPQEGGPEPLFWTPRKEPESIIDALPWVILWVSPDLAWWADPGIWKSAW